MNQSKAASSSNIASDIKQPSPITIVMVQDVFQVGDIKNNADKIIAASIKASQQGADLVVFPELALVGYPPEDLLHRQGFLQKIKQHSLRIQQALKQGVGDTGVVFGAPHEHAGKLYNAALYVNKGIVRQFCFKQSLPNYSVFDEVRYFSAGDKSGVIDVKGHKLGLLICEDVWQSACVEKSKENGAQAIIVLNASPFHINKYAERVAILKSHAKKFDLPILYLNMTGGQDELVFDGGSFAVNKQAELIARTKLFEDDLLDIVFDGNDITSQYALITESESNVVIYKALVTGVRDFVHQNGFTGVVIGLSGGIDSALTLAIAVDALGAQNVAAVMMPSRYTADISLQDAQTEAKLLGVQYDVIAIEDVFSSFLSSLAPVFLDAPADTTEDTTEENIQARCRGLMLMAISNKTGRMVLTTGNKSEMAVGYATLYGDMCGGFAPIKDVCKTLVYTLSRYRNSVSPVIPERVLMRPPTAELREDQCDQDSLPDYAVLDRILELSVEQDKPIDEIVAQGIERETVLQVITMVQRNEHKRRQSAPGIRITRRAFGRDRRYPITSGYRRS
ncbi:NAD synthetase / Glutamine amidotransferase chain of NAD synthetase [hydrothermal vent metagenome]|uniref:NAD(+) synthase (glutamine-hydrolyzing) n=1 Tax=hydrothermal vent metagenome TaxID=652676 RepID=A0A3B0WKX8_9ZZZZ